MAFEETQNKLDELRNLTWQNGKLVEALSQLSVNGLEVELQQGKEAIVNAIATKNIQSSTDKTLLDIASDIKSISQSSIVIDGGEMYEKQLFGAYTDKTNAYEQPDSPFWNLYQVMVNLLSDGRFVEYGGIVLCEYSKSVINQQFEGASIGGIYFTSEGKIIEEQTEYIWNDFNDGKANRWVAILNKSQYVDVTFTSVENTPNSIHIGRKVGLIKSTESKTNISEIVCTDGNEYTLKLAQTTNSFGGTLILRGLGTIDYDDIILGASVVDTNKIIFSVGDINSPNQLIRIGNASSKLGSIVFEKIGNVFRNLLYCNYGTGNPTPNYIEFPRGYKFNGDSIIFQFSSLTKGILTIRGLNEINKGCIIHNQNSITNTKLEEIYIPDLEKLGTGTLIKYHNNNQGGSYTALRKINVPKLYQANVLFQIPTGTDTSGANNLIDVVVGAMETSFNVSCWRPLNVLSDEDKVIQLNKNIREHIAERIIDCNGREPLTITFHQLVRNVLTEETEQVFANKNWNIAPAKSI